MVDFENLKVKDYVKCISYDGVPVGNYEFNGIILAKNVVVTNAIIDEDYGEIGVATIDFIVVDCFSILNWDLNIDFEKFGNDLDYRMDIIINGDLDIYYLKKEQIIEKISKNDILVMNKNIELFDKLADNIVVKLTNNDKIIYLKKENKNLFVSNDNQNFEKTYYTIFFYLTVGTVMIIL